MASRQSVSSILKPQKIRPPLMEIESVDQDADEDTATVPKKKVSFSGMNNIKMYITGASSLTVPTLFDEQISMMSDSSNGEKNKLSGKLEKSDGQMTLESTNCTNMEENDHVFIEYNSPNDNMEITEAFSGKIFLESIYSVDNNVSENSDCSLDHSANNMEFTEVVATDKILDFNTSNSNSIEMYETLNVKYEQLDGQIEHSSSIPLQDISVENISHIISHSNNNDMVNHQNVSSGFENNSNYSENMDEKLSVSVISMDIDSKYNGTKNDSFANSDTATLVAYDKTSPKVLSTLEIQNKNCDTSNIIEFVNHSNIDVGTPIVPTSSSFAQEKSLGKNFDESIVEKPLLHSTLLPPTCIFNKSHSEMDISLEVKENYQKNYSRKTMIHPPTLIIQKESPVSESMPDTLAITEKNNGKCPRKSLECSSEFFQTLTMENEDNISKFDIEENLENKCPIESIVPTSDFDQTLFKENKENLDTTVKVEESQHKILSRKSTRFTAVTDQNSFKDNNDYSVLSSSIEENQNLSKSMYNVTNPDLDQIQSKESINISDLSVLENKDEQKKQSRNSIVCTSTSNQNQLSQEMNFSNASMYETNQSLKKENVSIVVEKNKHKNYSRKTMGPTALTIASINCLDDNSLLNSMILKDGNNTSDVPNNSKTDALDSSNCGKKIILKSEHDSVLYDIIGDDDLNSPFRKKSRKSGSPIQSTNQPVYDLCGNNIDTSNNKQNKSENTNDSFTENIEYSKMDVSVEIKDEDYCIKNISAKDLDMSITKQTSMICKNVNSSSSMNDSLKQNSKENILLSIKESNLSTVTSCLLENEESKKNVEDGMYEIDDQKDDLVVSEKMEQNNIHTNKFTQDDICIDDLSNMSISDEIHSKYEKSFLESRKRSYGNRDGVLLSDSSFKYKSTIHNCTTDEHLNENNVLKESSINNENLMSTESPLKNTIDKPDTKRLHSEVTEFLTKWNDLYFVENQLVIDTCNNNEWIFNILDDYVKLVIKYSAIINDNSYLKVEDILLTSQKNAENEIAKFGIHWILSKYSPKIYKQICFTSRDVELLLKSLQDDIKFISLVMKNMRFVRDVYCVTFKDSKAQFFLQSMNPLLMARIDVSLVNIHKFSVRDITADCFFGDFDVKVLDEIVKNMPKDCNVLQFIVEKLKTFVRTIQVPAK